MTDRALILAERGANGVQMPWTPGARQAHAGQGKGGSVTPNSIAWSGVEISRGYPATDITGSSGTRDAAGPRIILGRARDTGRV